MAGRLLIALLVLLPKIFGPTILVRRAQHLRKVTGNLRFVSQSEIDQASMTARSVAVLALITPVEILIKDSTIFFVRLYSAMFYGCRWLALRITTLCQSGHWNGSIGLGRSERPRHFRNKSILLLWVDLGGKVPVRSRSGCAVCHWS